MYDNDIRVADKIARKLFDTTDVNELAQLAGLLRRMGDTSQFFNYLDTVINEGRAVVRSGRTLDYYRSIRNVCHESLNSYLDDADQMAWILGWAARLMRYYAVAEHLRITFPETTETTHRETGRVKFFREDKGYGFIKPDDGGRDVYVNQRDVLGRSLQQGQEVSYMIAEGTRGPKARDVRPENGS